jgi:hypothetical protein
MKIHKDEMENYKKKIDRFKDECARKNREIQKEQAKKKK